MRGATSATVGSQKWPSRASSQPRRGITSESRNATKLVLQAANPLLRAAAGPLLRAGGGGRREPAGTAGSVIRRAGPIRRRAHARDGRPARRTRRAAASESCQHPVGPGRPPSDSSNTIVNHLGEDPAPLAAVAVV